MERSEFLRKALNTFIVPTKTAYNVPLGEVEEILSNFVGVYIPKDVIIELMKAEGFVFRGRGVYTGHFRANFRIHPALLLNQHWSREYIQSQFPRREFERWDSLNDAIVVLKHIFANSHGRGNEDVDTAVRDILVPRDNADTDPAQEGAENPN